MELRNPIKKGIFGEVYLFFALLLSNIFSLFADNYWAFDLFSHFRVQYLAGAGIVIILLLFSRNWLLVFFTLIVGCFNAYEISKFSNKINLENWKMSIYSQNILVSNNNVSKIISHIKNNPYDIVILQEAAPDIIQYIDDLKKTYPYIIDKTKYNAYGYLILSKHKITKLDLIPFKHSGYFTNEAIKFSVYISSFDEDIVFYTIHTPPPIGKETKNWRDVELNDLSATIALDSSKYKIFLGDWNITPYSPVFKRIIEQSNLNYYSSGKYTVGTWPAFLEFKIFQIAIDQILVSDNLLADINIMEDSFGSDHYPLVTYIDYK